MALGGGALVPIAVGNILEFRVICLATDQMSVNVRHLRVSAVTGAVNLGNVSDRLDVLFAPLYKALMATDGAYRGVGVRVIRPLPVSQEAFTTTGAGVGTVVGDMLPRQVTGLIGLRCAPAGRKFRGRVYVPFPSETQNIGTKAAPDVGTYGVNLGNLATQFKTNIVVTVGANNATLVNVINHRSTATNDDITDATARGAWATQRKRGFFGRPNVPPF